jgi:signal transduction histidine kinase
MCHRVYCSRFLRRLSLETEKPSNSERIMSLGHLTPATVFGVLVTAPTLWLIAHLVLTEQDQLQLILIAWVVLIGAVELLRVPTWRGVEVSLGFPLLIAVAFTFPPGIAALVALLGSCDPREWKKEVTLLRAMFNRCQVALAVLAASATFHALTTIRAPLVQVFPAALLATLVDYVINLSLVTIGAALVYRVKPLVIVRELLGRGQEFMISYVGLGIVGTVLARLDSLPNIGFWSVLTVLAPLLFARQMFVRSVALEEAHKELQDREQVLRVLSNRMAEEREEERESIAGYLHDDLAQHLFRLSIQVDVARRHLTTGKLGDVETDLEKIKSAKQDTSDRVRQLIRELHRSPLGPAGLEQAIQSFVAETGRNSGVQFHTDIAEVELPAAIALLMYHNAREATMNSLKHANAKNFWITVHHDDKTIEMVLKDDGDGFDTSAPGPEGHFGMTMMRERAAAGGGTFEVQSGPGLGTTITVRFPTSLLGQDEEEGPVPTTNSPAPGGDASPGSHEIETGEQEGVPSSTGSLLA